MRGGGVIGGVAGGISTAADGKKVGYSGGGGNTVSLNVIVCSPNLKPQLFSLFHMLRLRTRTVLTKATNPPPTSLQTP